MIPVILQLQNDALDKSISISDLLRKAYLVSKKLGVAEFEQWTNNELNGYKTGEVPEYRVITGKIKGWNPYHGWIPLEFEDIELGNEMSKRNNPQAIPEIEHLLLSGNANLRMHFPQPVQTELSLRGFGFETQVSLIIQPSSLVRIVETVRTIILNWAIKLESEGVLGEGLIFTNREKDMAKQSHHVVTNFYGTVNSPQIQQANESALQINNGLNLNEVSNLLEDISKKLSSLGLDRDQSDEANAEIQTIKAQLSSPKPKKAVISESLKTLRTIFEGAAGSVAGQLVLEIGKNLY